MDREQVNRRVGKHGDSQSLGATTMHRPHIGDKNTERVLFAIYIVLTLLSLVRLGTIHVGMDEIALVLQISTGIH